MPLKATLAGCFLVALVLWESFETIVLPRRVSRRFRLTVVFYRTTWLIWRTMARPLRRGVRRETFLSFYGPASLICLIATWASLAIVGFGLIFRGTGTLHTAAGPSDLLDDIYFSGTCFFTIGLGDVTPGSRIHHVLTVLEGGTGLGFIALIIGYLPLLSQSFSRREMNVAMLDARAGSPPTAAELLRRHAQGGELEALAEMLVAWERWSAELLETHISYPVLAYYRSQHNNQNWLAALTAILDTCTLIIAGLVPGPVLPARLTFAMARHAAVDMTNILGRTPRRDANRLPAADLDRLRASLEDAGLSVAEGPAVEERLQHLRRKYEPYVLALGDFLLMPPPPWLPPKGAEDNWLSMM